MLRSKTTIESKGRFSAADHWYKRGLEIGRHLSWLVYTSSLICLMFFVIISPADIVLGGLLFISSLVLLMFSVMIHLAAILVLLFISMFSFRLRNFNGQFESVNTGRNGGVQQNHANHSSQPKPGKIYADEQSDIRFSWTLRNVIYLNIKYNCTNVWQQNWDDLN
jgi:flagellar basal body-associated protein FliL